MSHATHAAAVTETGPVSAEDVVRLRVALGRINRRMLRSSLGLSATQLSVLITLKMRGPSRLGELAACEGIAAPSMTRLAASLEGRDLLRRRPDPDDGRSVRVELTETGCQALDAERQERTAMLARRMSRLNDAEVDALVAALPVLERLATEDDEPRASAHGCDS